MSTATILAQVHLQASTSGDSTLPILAAPFVLGFIVYAAFHGLTYLYYRNTDKKYRFEQETAIEVRNVQAFDTPVQRRNGVQSSVIENRNSNRPRERVQRVRLEP